MKRPKLLVCLPTDDNDYQCLQATDAQQIAELVDVDIDVIYADNSAVEQSVKLAKIVQSNAGERPSAIIVEPVGTGMVQVAKRATSGMGWALLNRHVDYIGDLRKQSALVFAVSTDHEGMIRFKGGRLRPCFPTAAWFCASRNRARLHRNAPKVCGPCCPLTSKSEQFVANGLRRAPAAR
jgi:hypothetical protein